MSTVRRPDVVPVLAVAGGGAVGAALRWGVGQWLPWHPPAFPWATATVNVVGCLAIGLVLGWLLTTAGQPRWLRPFLATGLLGGFTTFSAFAVETVRLLDDGAGSVALAYVAASLALGLLAVRVGARTVVRIRRA